MPVFPVALDLSKVQQGNAAGVLVALAKVPELQDVKTIQAERFSVDTRDGSKSYSGNVVVRYGLERLTADRVVVYDEQKRGIAEGRVTLVDPDGTATADRIEFSWDPANQRASGENVEIRVAGALLRARRATFAPGEWTLFDAEGTNCLRGTPVYLVTSEKLVVRPGQQVVVTEPRVSVLGHFLAELPTQRVALSRAVPGIRLPAPSYRPGRGFGATWNGGLVTGKDSTFTFNAQSFQSTKPSGLALYTRSFLPISQSSQIVAPRTDFAERFNFGYMDSVLVRSLGDEASFLRARRSTLSGGGQLNGSVVDRDRGTRYSKVEAVYEGGGVRNGLGVLGQARLQGLQREDDGMEPRLAFTGSAGLPSVELRPGLTTIARLDSALFAGRTAYGWGRAMAGLSYTPAPWLRLSAAGFTSIEGGNPQFDIDPLYAKDGLLMRADLAVGGLKLSYLLKDDVRRGLYDRELSISQVIGCVEAFYVQREYPRDRRIGVNLRLEPLIDLFRRRGIAGGIAAPSSPSKAP